MLQIKVGLVTGDRLNKSENAANKVALTKVEDDNGDKSENAANTGRIDHMG